MLATSGRCCDYEQANARERTPCLTMDEVHAAVHLAHGRGVQEVDGRQVEVRNAGRCVLLRGYEDLELLLHRRLRISTAATCS